MRFHGVMVTMTAAMLSSTIGTTMADVRIGSPVLFYSVYEEYPEYCSTPPMMAQRKIPILNQDSRLGETRLVHVTAVIRHGARTPLWGDNPQCWEGFWENPETAVWNCSLLTQMGPPTPKQAKMEEGMDVDDGLSDTIVLFEKRYDALMDPKNDLSNKLDGTCQMGQLLLQGYDQHVTNGQMLRDAYCYDSNLDVNDHDIRMRLLEVNAQNNQPWAPPQVYLRSDDDQRVLVSGQVLVRSMFEQEIAEAAKKGQQIRIPVHLADYDQDIVGLSESVCPRLTEMREDFEKSSIFKRYNTSNEANEIYSFIKNDLKATGPMDVIDCLMTTVCTDRPLHPAFDYGGKSNMFDRLATFAYRGFNMLLLANAAEYAKLGSAPLWSEIMDRVNPIINSASHDPPTRLAVVSGHDDTISPLMASLGIWNDTMWPAYASMFLIEIHEIIDSRADHSKFPSKFAFRLIYNGQVLTPQVKGCLDDAELCDIKVLTSLIADFSSRNRDCKPRKRSHSHSVSWFSGPLYSFLVLLLGAVAGGVGMSFYMTGAFPFCFGKEGGYSERSGMSMPHNDIYSDDPPADRYQDDPDKNGGIAFME